MNILNQVVREKEERTQRKRSGILFALWFFLKRISICLKLQRKKQHMNKKQKYKWRRENIDVLFSLAYALDFKGFLFVQQHTWYYYLYDGTFNHIIKLMINTKWQPKCCQESKRLHKERERKTCNSILATHIIFSYKYIYANLCHWMPFRWNY